MTAPLARESSTTHVRIPYDPGTMAALLRCAIAMLLAAVLDGNWRRRGRTPVASGDAAGIGTTTVLAAPGQSAALLTSPAFNTNLELVPGAQYLIAIVNTNAADTVDPKTSHSRRRTRARRLPQGTLFTAQVPKRPPIRYSAAAAAEPRYEVTTAAVRRAASMRSLQQHHLAMLDRDARILEDRQSFGALRPWRCPLGPSHGRGPSRRRSAPSSASTSPTD